MAELTSVKYIGKRAEYTDGTYGTRIHFIQGESKMVPADKAKLMFKHPDVYVPGAKSAPVAEVAIPKESQDEATQEIRDSIAFMDKDALATYAQTHFSTKIDRRKDVGQLRAQVTGLVDQFGVN